MKKLILILIIIFCFPFTTIGQEQESGKVIAYYFHGDFRCWSCYTIEEYTKRAIEENFQDELSTGELELKIVNYDKPENRHFIEDYQLYTKSVVLSLVKGGKEVKFKNLEQIWQLLRNKDKFYQYIKSETQGFLDNLREGGQKR